MAEAGIDEDQLAGDQGAGIGAQGFGNLSEADLRAIMQVRNESLRE